MGQQEVYDFLKDYAGEWYTSREIAKALDISIGSVTMSLKKLRKTNIINFQNTGLRNTFRYSIRKRAAKSAKMTKIVITASITLIATLSCALIITHF